MHQLSGWDDTIVALATPPGVGAIGVIRVSGQQALAIVGQLFPAKDLRSLPSHTVHVGLLQAGNKVLDEVIITLFKSPRSYTGEEVVEISCHGSPLVQREVLDAIVQLGARLARPGEFTQRAFLKGKLDLTQAEAVADLIAAGTEAAQRAALQGLRGGFSAELKQLREQLIQFSSLLELELDFSQENVTFADRTQLKELLNRLAATTQTLLQSFKLGNVIKNGVSVAIVGKPNAGKSTLLNSLLNENRAIVSEIAGTTRDTIEEVVNIEGVLFRLIDTAGLRANTIDQIEQVGIERSFEKMSAADLVLYLFDVADPYEEVMQWAEEAREQGLRFLLVGNKIDLASAQSLDERSSQLPVVPLLIAAKDKTNLEALKAAILKEVLSGQVLSENIVVTNERHYQALQQVSHALEDTRKGIEEGLASDLVALEIRRCLQYLGEITGEITNEEQLDFIFSKFCIGK
ncbi:MAG: tRNA uridine-5-carboxymethylaminomethyl(34) synthesis GTPase MnmE [Bacteroidetes bacterium]|nr:tRNA uridine-5-carboxymethylaminomethyl(34) synthesis GTPase MnmE [Bacteroidota bacterium]